MKRRLKQKLKRAMRWAFETGQRFGVDLLPHHFYSPIPNIADLKRDPYWQQACTMHGVAGCDVADQMAFIASCCNEPWSGDVHAMNVYESAVLENGEDGGYGPIEAEFLYCFVRSRRPQKIVQIGCGVSTSILLRAAQDAGYQPQLICVEPYPMPFLRQQHDRQRIQLIQEKAQKVSLEILTSLDANDFFFIDSTHTVKPGSEVNRLILEVLPRLSPGVWVHLHDIYFPYDYRRDLMDGDLFFWSESTLLHAFLIHNAHCKIVASLSMIHYRAANELRKFFPNYAPQPNQNGLRGDRGGHFPSSIYLQTN